MESSSQILLGSQSEEFGWFPSMSTSSTPIWVDTKEVGHIHVLLPTLEYSAPLSSPAVPGMTNPELFVVESYRCRVLLKTFIGCFENFWSSV